MFNVLIVDDKESVRISHSHILKVLDYEVITAENGEVGLEYYKKYNPDFVLSDLNMPVKKGNEMYEDIFKYDPKVKLCFVISYEEFIFLPSNVIHIPCILKPLSIVKLKEFFDKFLTKQYNSNSMNIMRII